MKILVRQLKSLKAFTLQKRNIRKTCCEDIQVSIYFRKIIAPKFSIFLLKGSSDVLMMRNWKCLFLQQD